MATHYAVIRRSMSGCSRTTSSTYVNVVSAVRVTAAPWADLLSHPNYSNPANPEFVVELTQEEYFALQSQAAIFHDGNLNLPRLQQRVATNGAPKEFGSFATPTDAGSAWSTAQIPDDRLIVRIYDGNPAAGGAQLGTRVGDPPSGEFLDEDDVTGFVTRYLRLFSAADSPLAGFHGANQKTLIAGKQMIFDFGNSAVPSLPGGVATFEVETREPGEIEFPSNHAYRVLGPSGQKAVTWTIYGRTLTVK